jgi:hypothetical protein
MAFLHHNDLHKQKIGDIFVQNTVEVPTISIKLHPQFQFSVPAHHLKHLARYINVIINSLIAGLIWKNNLLNQTTGKE